MLSCSLYDRYIFTTILSNSIISRERKTVVSTRKNHRVFINAKQSFSCSSSSVNSRTDSRKSVHYNSLKSLEWDKLCESVASFARSSLGRDATKAQLWSLNQTFEESLKLLDETNAAIEMHKHGIFNLDLTGTDLTLVKSATRHARSSHPLQASEALALVTLLQFVDALQLNMKAALKEDADRCKKFMPLTDMIMQLIISRPLIQLIEQVVDEDGYVKDSASSPLKRARDQVRTLERKLYQLLDTLIKSEIDEASPLEVSNFDGRWCIKSGAGQQRNFKGLLLSSGSGMGSIVEPLSVVSLNDELAQARALVANAEADVLSMLTEKVQTNLDEIENILDRVIQLDIINARATYSLSYGGTCPDIFLLKDEVGSMGAHDDFVERKTLKESYPKRGWVLYLPKAYHPLLLQQHRQNLRNARKDLKDASTEIRRNKLQGKNATREAETDNIILSLKQQVSALEQSPPVPVDFLIAERSRVLVITGPNTGGKTICLKTIGLAAMMGKSGLHVLSSESARLPWFDFVFADIGDEQSLSQSLSTFSGHLKQINVAPVFLKLSQGKFIVNDFISLDIQSHSTSRSLVLLDEVGAGTNPLEGAALGMSLLEHFSENGALLTIATTHHGELKTLKYSNAYFENACMEFDEVNLKPTYKILWGVPGRSNAINIAERLKLPSIVIDDARKLYGATSAEINEVIIDMERFKQDFQELLYDARRYLMISRELYENLVHARNRIMEHANYQAYEKVRAISAVGARARSVVHNKVRQIRASATQSSQLSTEKKRQTRLPSNSQHTVADTYKDASYGEATLPSKSENSVKRTTLPKIGDMVRVSSLGVKATVLKVEPSKKEVIVKVGNMSMKLKLVDVVM